MKERFIENGIEYVRNGDYYIPNLKSPEGTYNIGKYGKLHSIFIKENRPAFYSMKMLNGQTNGYSYGELVDIANNAIWQYRDMYLRPDFYANNLEKVRIIIAPVIEDYKSGKITYAEAEFDARNKIYQSVKPDFNPDVEYMKDPLSRDIPSVDNSLFILTRKLLFESK